MYNDRITPTEYETIGSTPTVSFKVPEAKISRMTAWARLRIVYTGIPSVTEMDHDKCRRIETIRVATCDFVFGVALANEPRGGSHARVSSHYPSRTILLTRISDQASP